MDPLYGRLPGTVLPLTCHSRPLCHLAQPPAPGLLFSDGGSPSGGYRRDAPVLGSSPGVRVSAIRLYSESPHQGSPIPQPRGDPGGSVLTPEAVVPGSLGAPSGSASPSSHVEGSSPPTAFPSFPSEPPCARSNWLSYCERSVRHFGFSLRMSRQLTFCRRFSTRITYQVKWTTYRSWCCSHGHSVSRLSVSKVADFLLYLHRSLHLSYSSITSYRSILSDAFRFVLPELSSHPVLHDLLQSFHLERPLPSSRVPPWDLLHVRSPLRGPPFEPLSSCSLQDLTHKVLFLLSLATARRVGELHTVSSSVSFSGGDIFLSYLPEFGAKSESAANPLPCSFCVRSLRDFVGTLPGELLLCPVHALQVYLDRTSSLSPHLRSLFVSPRSPSRPLPKNTLSFFLRSIILQSFPSPSSVCAHSICGMATSTAFSRDVPISSILEAATWSSSTVFTSFYLCEVEFSSSSGFSLGSVVAAGAVI